MSFPLQLEYLTWLQAALIFLAGAGVTLLLGWKALNALGSGRKWTAIVLRLLVIATIVLILGGARWERTNKKVELIVVRDVSASAQQVQIAGGGDVDEAVEQWVRNRFDDDINRIGDDRVGVISFDRDAYIDLVPNTQFELGARSLRDPRSGSDAAAGINLALASLNRDAMHRLLLVWDGNATQGDLDAAIEAAASQGVPIDVMPLPYDIDNEVVVEDLIAPPLRDEKEPFSIDVILRSTNAISVSGNLTVRHQSGALDLDPDTPGRQEAMRVTLRPGRNRVPVRVPAMSGEGVHQFRAVFEPDTLAGELAGRGRGADTLLGNNAASGFTLVSGSGRVLYVDGTGETDGQLLFQAFQREAIDVKGVLPEQFPATLLELEPYDAVVLANVRRGPGGLSEQQQLNLANYVHETGGGLVMIGGPDTFGAGGWLGSKLEEVLPISMDVPAKRELPKGALGLLIHSVEMPDGNYWGEQCAIKAVEVLNARDDVAVVSYNWGGINGGGNQFDYPFAQKGDGSRVIAAIKGMQNGDAPAFHDALDIFMNGDGTNPGMVDLDARQKHVIIISDGDPSGPSQRLLQQYVDNKVSISTVTVYPHPGMGGGAGGNGIPPLMRDLARLTGGNAYGPINANPNQLPQIFVKEATVVRRSLIQESSTGIPVQRNPVPSDMTAGLAEIPPVFGYVITTKKESPLVEMPFTLGKENDPLMATWRSGLGKSAVWTSDASNQWGTNVVGSPLYDKLFAQMVRGVRRPRESTDFDVRTAIEGNRGTIVVEAFDRENAFRDFLTVAGSITGPDGQGQPVRLQQVGPGKYEGSFDASGEGNYVVGLQYTSPDGDQGRLRGGTTVNGAPELRNLSTDMGKLLEIAERTGGRVLEPFDAAGVSLFTRDGLRPSSSPSPIWDLLIPVAIALLLLDVAVRRIALDYLTVKTAMATGADRTRSFFMAGSRQHRTEQNQSLDSLRNVREGKEPEPVSTRKFEASEFGGGVEGDLTSVIGGATDKPIPKDNPAAKPKADREKPGEGGMASLMEAKRRAREKMKKDQEGR
ncbi:MAG: hypothetical protein AAGD32_16885 [Planctomycetota bacterium]